MKVGTMAAQSKAAPQTRTADGRWPSGVSGNPGGMPKGLRQQMAVIALAHGGKILTALQRLFEMGMDERTYISQDREGEDIEVPIVDAKIRVTALDAFVRHTAALSGLAGVARAVPEEGDVPADEGELLERVVDSVLRRAPEMVEAKLSVIRGGKP